MGSWSQSLALAAVAGWAGSTLLLSRVTWFARRPLGERLRRHVPGAPPPTRTGLLSVESFRDALGPVARFVGERLARAAGIGEDLALRLERIHSPLDPTTFRVRQMGWAAVGLAGGVIIAAAVADSAPIVALIFLLGGPLLAFLIVEQQLAAASAERQRRLFLELPVVAEQLGMLLGAGYSLGAALNRIAQRGSGVIANDLRVATGRIRQGLTEVQALREWADVADVTALHRLVSVLALNRQAGDLGRLISEEARAIRREVQRQLIEQIERRAQQVWIPVTVATLVPGAIVLAVPFFDALRQFSTI